MYQGLLRIHRLLRVIKPNCAASNSSSNRSPPLPFRAIASLNRFLVVFAAVQTRDVAKTDTDRRANQLSARKTRSLGGIVSNLLGFGVVASE